MSPTTGKTFTFVLPDALKVALQKVRDRDGVSEAEQIRRGIRMWLDEKGVAVKSNPKRVRARKRP